MSKSDTNIEVEVTVPEKSAPAPIKPEFPDASEMIRQHRVGAWLAVAFTSVFTGTWVWAVFFGNGSMLVMPVILATSFGFVLSFRAVLLNFIAVGDFKAMRRRDTAVDIFAGEK